MEAAGDGTKTVQVISSDRSSSAKWDTLRDPQLLNQTPMGYVARCDLHRIELSMLAQACAIIA